MLGQDTSQEEGSALAHSCSIGRHSLLLMSLCCWSQREEAEMKVGTGKGRVMCKITNLSILITTMVIISDVARIKYAWGAYISTAPGLLSDKLINHNNVEIHTQNGCLGQDWLFFHYSDMERAKRNVRVKEVVKRRNYFLNHNEGVQASKLALQSDPPLERLLFLCLHFGVSSIFFCPRVGFLWMQNKSTSSGMMMEYFLRVSRMRLQIWLTKWTALSAVGAWVQSAE